MKFRSGFLDEMTYDSACHRLSKQKKVMNITKRKLISFARIKLFYNDHINQTILNVLREITYHIFTSNPVILIRCTALLISYTHRIQRYLLP